MSVTIDDVKYIAKLSKLKFNDEELQQYTEQLNRILEHMEKLNELDTSNVEPLSHPIEKTNVFRDDDVGESVSTLEALKNSPKNDGKYFKVPKVISQ